MFWEVVWPVVGIELTVTNLNRSCPLNANLYFSGARDLTTQSLYGQPESAFGRIMSEAPYLPRCSADKTATLVKPKAYAVRYPYMQVNRKDWVSWLIFDLDHDNPWIWHDAGVPEPNLIVSNPVSGTSHLYYAISPDYTGDSARHRPINYKNAIYEAMAVALDADLNYRGPVAKTPGHKWWKTTQLHTHEYQLDELAQGNGIELPSAYPWSKRPDIDAVSHSRHCLLFEDVRHFAYRIVNGERESGSFKRFKKRVEAYAIMRNKFTHMGFAKNLRHSQVNATVKSVCGWTWDKYTGGAKCLKGVLRLNKAIPLKERQRQAAKYTNSKRKRNTELRIEAAWKSLKECGTPITFGAIARASGLSRQTIAKYDEYIKRLSKSRSNIIKLSKLRLGTSRSPIHIVNYGVHQITAPLKLFKKVRRDEEYVSLFKINKNKVKPPI